MIRYTDSLDGVTPILLRGFFSGWKKPLSPENHFTVLKNSDHFVLAIDVDSGMVIGFVTALTDHVQSGFIPLLEVLPAYRSRGVGRTLVSKILEKLREIPAVDLTCDPALQGFYSQFGMSSSVGMVIRNY